MKGLWLFFAGLLFAGGLGLSGMTHPEKVSAFLDVAGAWDPSLAFVMVGAIAVYFAAHRLTRQLRRPLYGERFPPPPPAVDGRLLAGAAIFGVGWGLSGFCPGPALVSLGAGTQAALWFAPSMVAGVLLFNLIARPRAQDSRD